MQQLAQVQIQFHLLTAFGPAFLEKVGKSWKILLLTVCGNFVTTLISKEDIDVSVSQFITNYDYSISRIEH